MQVAKQSMPVSSIVVGVDLFPIKPIPGCIGLVEDITTDKCKSMLTKELQTWKADVILHDGAPNVGKNWLYDAYQQICLTLNALKLSTNFLRSGGWFVTKVFRSKDYNALLWVLKQLFKKVHATKPSASRKESAEIFVVCQGYLAPDKIDPRFLDPKYVFEELELDTKSINLLNPESQKRIKAEGYSEQDFHMRDKLNVSTFLQSENGLIALQGVSIIKLDNKDVANHPSTTFEIKECLKDIKVLGRKDLRSLLAWWKEMKELFYKEVDPNAKVEEEETVPAKKLTEEEEEDLEFEEIEKHIAEVAEEEQKDAKRKKKKTNKERTKLNEKLNLKMILKYDDGPKEEADDMFDFNAIGGLSSLKILDDQAPDTLAESDEETKEFIPKYKRYDKEKLHLDDNGMYVDEDEINDGWNEKASDDDEDDESDMEETGLGLDDLDHDDNVSQGKKLKKNKKKEVNPLIVDLDHRDKDTKRRQRVQLWFEKDKLKEMDDDDNEGHDLDKLTSEYKKKGVKVLGSDRTQEEEDELDYNLMGRKAKRRARHQASKDNSSSEESSDDDDEGEDEEDQDLVNDDEDIKVKKVGGKDGFEIVSADKKKKYKLNEKELALGAMLIKSKKVRRDLTDAAWNRYAFNDDDLPEWFVKDEELHMRKEAPVPKELVQEYRDQVKELNIRPLKKVIEAKARKKRRTMKRFEKAKKKAESILENADASSQEKARQLKKLYKSAEGDKKKEVTYVVAKKHSTAKRMKRPTGVKGRYKVVDNRLKKDTRAKLKLQKKKR